MLIEIFGCVGMKGIAFYALQAMLLAEVPHLHRTANNNIGLIIGATVGAVVFIVITIVTILCIFRCRGNQTTDLNEVHLVQYETPTQTTSMYQDPNGMQFFTKDF